MYSVVCDQRLDTPPPVAWPWLNLRSGNRGAIGNAVAAREKDCPSRRGVRLRICRERKHRATAPYSAWLCIYARRVRNRGAGAFRANRDDAHRLLGGIGGHAQIKGGG